MTHYTELNDFGNQSEGLHVMFQYVADVVPMFFPFVLFAFFTIIMSATFFSQERLRGRGDWASSFAVAGFSTVIAALSLSLVESIINIQTLTVTILISIVGVVWLFMSSKQD